MMLSLLVSMTYAQFPVQLWHQKPGSNIGAAMNLAVDVQGRIFAAVYNDGIYRSSDTGKTWQQVAPFTDGVWSFAVRPGGDMIASLWSRGVFRSTNAGDTWIVVPSNKLYADLRAVNANGHIFIEAEGRLLRSTDTGISWISVPIGAGVIARNGETIVAAKGAMVFRSTDNGVQWSYHSTLSSPVYALNISPLGKITAGTYHHENDLSASIFSYHEESNTWNGAGPPSTINMLLRRNDGTLFAATHDSGFYSSPDNGAHWRQINYGLTVTKIYALALFADTMIIAGTLDGIFMTNNLSKILAITSEDPEKGTIAHYFQLKQNYPNPFNPSTTISYTIAVGGHVTLTVTDLLGRISAMPVDQWQNAGEHSVQVHSDDLFSGMYYYTLRIGTHTATKKMLLLR
ncbi:MAG: T9SS type A sorting domain-containing protein [Bacteriovoracaceae bacterium]